jgi:hypothetical protein
VVTIVLTWVAMFVNDIAYTKLPILEAIAAVVYICVFIALVRVLLEVRSGPPLTAL